jgi:exosortase
MISADVRSPTAPVSGRGPTIPWPILFAMALWIWATWSCAEHWRGNPNYSYGWTVPALALGFGIRRYLTYRASTGEVTTTFRFPVSVQILVAIVLGALVFLLEYAREQVLHPMIVIWSICALAVTSTITLLWWRSGRDLARAELFPVCFFLTAVPWPPRFEQPITSTLMRWVASATTELLHWWGIEAQASGGAIALRTGLVGITEACSGIRSLQAGIMFGLAMGEWFLLSAGRRFALLAIAIIFALATNLARTLALTLQAHWHGVESVDRVHDLIGNVIITALVLAIWLVGKLLAQPAEPPALPARSTSSFSDLFRALTKPSPRIFAMLTLTFLAGIVSARALSVRLEAKDATQTSPFFVAKIDKSGTNRLGKIPREVWNELRPTTGEYIRHDNAALPRGGADCFHFFWKPSPWNRFALVHRPDICMPGVGWQMIGAAEVRETELDGHPLRCYIFRFHRGNAHALELWGAWRNGDAVPLDYQPDQVLGVTAPPAALRFEGKRRSATEIVSCSVIAEGAEPPADIAVEILQSVFKYSPQ